MAQSGYVSTAELYERLENLQRDNDRLKGENDRLRAENRIHVDGLARKILPMRIAEMFLIRDHKERFIEMVDGAAMNEQDALDILYAELTDEQAASYESEADEMIRITDEE